MQLNAYPALVLNADFRPKSYFPLSTIGWQDSVKAVYEGTHVVVREYDIEVKSPSLVMKLPSVLAVRSYVHAPSRVAFTRYNVFLRDRFRCQYCGDRHVANDLTFDHVVPRSRGGKTVWDNIVTCCDPCNGRKDDKTLAEAGMHLKRLPQVPTPGDLIAGQRGRPPGYLHESWADFLYWDSPLEE